MILTPCVLIKNRSLAPPSWAQFEEIFRSNSILFSRFLSFVDLVGEDENNPLILFTISGQFSSH